MSVVYDARVLVAADRNDRNTWADHRVRLELGLTPITTALVVAQTSRSPRQAQLRRFLRGCEIAAFMPEQAHEVGALLGSSDTSDVVDAHVEKISCAPAGAAACSSFTANTFSLVSTDGQVLGTTPYTKAASVAPGYVRANTVVLNDGTWTDISQMRAGTADTKPIPATAEISSLSPDGTTMVVPGTPSWELVDLRTGISMQLGTTAVASNAGNYNGVTIVWSPDGRSFVAPSATGEELLWVPTTAEAGSVVGKLSQSAVFAWLP